MNILVLTSIYPQQDDDKNAGVTPVVKYFVDEWKKMGHEIIVIHNANKYPKIFYMLPNRIIQIINSKAGIVVPNKNQRVFLYDAQNGVKSYRLPITKIIPKGRFFKFQINSQYKKIIKVLCDEEFKPDVVIGHWQNPQAPLISLIKEKFKCKTALVIHNPNNVDKDWIRNYIKMVDVIGCRSIHMSKVVKSKLLLDKLPFVCYSGIPDKYVMDNVVDITKIEKRNNIDQYLYVGQLKQNKNVDTIIKALNIAYPDRKFFLNIIGIGALEDSLKQLAKELGISDNIKFNGRIDRDDVIDIMRRSDVFTMVSKNEAFGLVYLEAMCSGCIVVASKGEGIDGVIVNSENGFLCKSGDVEELANIYKKYRTLSKKEKMQLLKNATDTVKEYTDSKVATRYLENIILESIE